MEDKKEDGEAQERQTLDHQLLIGDTVLFLQILDGAVHILDIGLQIIFLVPPEEVKTGDDLTEEADEASGW